MPGPCRNARQGRQPDQAGQDMHARIARILVLTEGHALNHGDDGLPEHPFMAHMMTARYARLSDTTIRRHWEAARKVNVKGQQVTLDPAGPLAEAAWAKQQAGRATQALPNGYCGLPMVKACPHANACLTCPMFITTPQFLPQHHEHRQQVIQIISTAQARGPAAAGRDEPASTGQPRPDHHHTGRRPREQGRRRCRLTTPPT